MTTVPSAKTRVSDTAGATARGLDVICVIAPVSQSADLTPRLFGKAAAIYAQHAYSDSLEYAAYHISKTGKSVLFIGVPIAQPGVVGRIDNSGNTGTSAVSVVAGSSGILGEHDGVVTCDVGGTIGVDQIKLSISLDGGRSKRSVRLGTGNSYTIPYIGAALSFGAGTLVADDVVLTWHGSSPKADASGWQQARARLAAQQKMFRSVMNAVDFANHDEANAYRAEWASYRTENDRFVYARGSVPDHLPQAALSHESTRMTGNPSLTFAEVGASGDTITRAAGSWLSDGFHAGDWFAVTGSASNNVAGVLASLSGTVLTLGTTDLAAEVASNVTVTAAPAIAFASHTATRNRGSWLDDGFRIGDSVPISGTASNNVTAVVTAVSALVLTFGATTFVGETLSSASVTMTAGQTKAAWMAAQDAEFETVRGGEDGFRLDLGAGRARIISPFSGWLFRRPVSWDASAREYQHDLHIATWRKSDGPTGADLNDADGQLVEWDDYVDGGAGSAAGFTTYRTWSNGPEGAFITQSLTRADEDSLLSMTHNVSVVNLACTVNQVATENFVGRSLLLNDDGTATTDSLSTLESEVNAALELALLQNRGEGQRASKATWTASTDDILNIPEAELTGTLDLNLNGTIHSVNTTVRLRSGGQ